MVTTRWRDRLGGTTQIAISRRTGYHSALEVRTSAGRYVIESAPIRAADPPDRGVVAEGPVGSTA